MPQAKGCRWPERFGKKRHQEKNKQFSKYCKDYADSTARILPTLVDVFQDTSVTISGLAFKASTIPVSGDSSLKGTIVNSGVLTLIKCTISGNRNGGIYNDGILTLRNSMISGNDEFAIDNSGRFTLQNSTVSGNRNGGIYNEGGFGVTLTIINSTISGNTTSIGVLGFITGGVVGGITNYGTLTIRNSTISRNVADAAFLFVSSAGPPHSATSTIVTVGGGILNEGTLTVTNSTISDNTASGRESRAPPKSSAHYRRWGWYHEYW